MTGKPKENITDKNHAETTNIYILPLFEDEAPDRFNILIQTDGNNRAKGLNQGYDDGGKNVVTIARHLAARGDVSTMLACIMSCDNADKRSEDFFWKMYQAFVALGMRMQTDGILINDKIRLNVKGQLAKLKIKGGNAQKLAEMIEQVCRLTDGIQDPKLTLSLGVNYDADIALDNEVDIIVRSGMEEPDSVRLSGMRSSPRISNVGSTTLWPHVSTSEIDGIIENSKKNIARGFRTGHEPDNIVKIVTETKPATPDPVTISIPFSGDGQELINTLDKNFPGTEEPHAFTIHVRDKSGGIVRTYGDDPKSMIYEIVPGSAASDLHPEDGYNMIVAPGQTEGKIVLPERPEADYATVLSCEKNPESIADAIQKAVHFCLRHEKLKGAERKISAGKDKLATDLYEHKRYGQLREHFRKNSSASVEAIARQLATKNPELNLFDLKADLFVGKMLEWGEKIGAPLGRDVEFLAFTNYALTSFFMVHFPGHPDWEKYSQDWEKRAEILAKYMCLIYMLDEVFDMEDENPETKMPRITRATEIVTAAIYHKDPPGHAGEETDPAIKKIAVELRKLSEELREESHPEMYRRWQKALAHLFQSFTEEWNGTVFDNPLVRGLVQKDSETGREEFRKRYYEEKPAFVRQKLDAALGEKERPNTYDIQLFTYLFDIENSIGAGLAYRTLATTIPHDEIDEKFTAEFEEICTLSNLYFRLANDLAGFLSRNRGDIETKQDACTIMTAKHMGMGKQEPEAILCAAAEIKTLIDELKREINAKRSHFARKWPRLGTSIIRADIAELIYKEGHYRTTDRDKMTSYFDKLKNSGIVESSDNNSLCAQSAKTHQKDIVYPN